MLTDEGDISNYLGVNIKKNSDSTFELSQSHMVEKIINHVGLEVSASLKARELENHYCIKTNLIQEEILYGITGQQSVC